MNNKGFTLVEVLAMLVVLGILMGISIPNIAGILNNHKMSTIKADATKMVDNAKIKISTNKSIKNPSSGECLLFSLNDLNISDDINEGPNGGIYKEYDSFVIVSRPVGKKSYEYYVRLVEELNGGDYGISFANIKDVSTENTKEISTVKDSYNMVGNDSDKTTILTNPAVSSVCPSGISSYYTGN